MEAPKEETQTNGTAAPQTNGTDGLSMNTSDPLAALTPAERKRIQSQFGNPKPTEAKYLLGQVGQTETLTKQELNAKATLYFKNCKDCHYTINSRCVKVLIEGCENCTVQLNRAVTTGTVEIWKCNGSKLSINTDIGTVQADLCEDLHIEYHEKEHLGRIVWAAMNNFLVTFKSDAELRLQTGFEQMKEMFPNTSRFDIDQFIIRFVEGQLRTEEVKRLENGFPTTEREIAEFEELKKRNDAAYLQKVRELVKESPHLLHGLKRNTPTRTNTKQVGRNEKCPCNSGKKYKKCCAGKEEAAKQG
ncbi:DUF1186 domain-containing protein [Balamuthia mandrillaris]